MLEWSAQPVEDAEAMGVDVAPVAQSSFRLSGKPKDFVPYTLVRAEVSVRLTTTIRATFSSRARASAVGRTPPESRC